MQTWLVRNRLPFKSHKRLGLKNWLAYQFMIGGTVITLLISLFYGYYLFIGLTRAYWLEKSSSERLGALYFLCLT